MIELASMMLYASEHYVWFEKKIENKVLIE
jgi:hypothetical protein